MPTFREHIDYSARLFKSRVGALLLGRASRKQQNLLDRICACLLAWLTESPGAKPDDFMRDEIIDAEVEFDPAELDLYQQSGESGAAT